VAAQETRALLCFSRWMPRFCQVKGDFNPAFRARLLPRFDEPKTTKNRIHFDLTADDHAAELARLTGLGARVVAELPGWTTLEDPEGNEFDLLI
jgi:Glyoxalase-like domain